MSTSTYFGFKCPKCGTTVDIGVGQPKCPNCKTPMVPNLQARPVGANVFCQTCSTSFGMVNSDRCPKCGGKLTRTP